MLGLFHPGAAEYGNAVKVNEDVMYIVAEANSLGSGVQNDNGILLKRDFLHTGNDFCNFCLVEGCLQLVKESLELIVNPLGTVLGSSVAELRLELCIRSDLGDLDEPETSAGGSLLVGQLPKCLDGCAVQRIEGDIDACSSCLSLHNFSDLG